MAYDGVGTNGNQLTTGGAGTLPTWSTGSGAGITTINVQTFTTNGTYTPSVGLQYAVVELVGGGGGGGGAAGSTTSGSSGAGGGGGGYSRKLLDAATVGASQAVTIGAGGAGGSPNNTGSNGGTTTFGTIFSATGGAGGPVAIANSTDAYVIGGQGGSGTNGDINCVGGYGGPGTSSVANGDATIDAGYGGSSFYSGMNSFFARPSNPLNFTYQGNNGSGYGMGGSGSLCSATTGSNALNGGNGSPGVCIVTEYIA